MRCASIFRTYSFTPFVFVCVCVTISLQDVVFFKFMIKDTLDNKDSKVSKDIKNSKVIKGKRNARMTKITWI